MSKQITNGELAEAVMSLLVGRLMHTQLDDAGRYAAFMTDIAAVICDYCGGEVVKPANDTDGVWMVGVRGNESVPNGGGVWKDFDPEGDLFF